MRKIDLRSLKLFVTSSFPPTSILRQFILMEADGLSTVQFLDRVATWLQLLSLEEHR